jgi:hypothetical protein
MHILVICLEDFFFFFFFDLLAFWETSSPPVG